MTEHRYAKRVREDFLSGVGGTPTFFINGSRYEGSYDLDSLLAGIEEAIETKRR
jgi:protein-disulfide isomerase